MSKLINIISVVCIFVNASLLFVGAVTKTPSLMVLASLTMFVLWLGIKVRR